MPLRVLSREGRQLGRLRAAVGISGPRQRRTETEAAAERKEAQEYMRRAAPQGKGKGFGTLGDLLREKLRR